MDKLMQQLNYLYVRSSKLKSVFSNKSENEQEIIQQIKAYLSDVVYAKEQGSFLENIDTSYMKLYYRVLHNIPLFGPAEMKECE